MTTTKALHRGWWGTDLGEYRACDGTYACYKPETMPPLDNKLFDGSFAWLSNSASKAKPKPAKNLASLLAAAKKASLSLPSSFVTFFENGTLAELIPSCTACEWDLATEPYAPKLPGGGKAVRFLRDQQDCLFWYLVVGGAEDGKVVCSPIPWHDADAVAEDEDVVIANSVVVADSFEAFVYRFWIENVLWDLVQSNGPYTKEQRAYLDHYSVTRQ
jgi:hypothetical protein